MNNALLKCTTFQIPVHSLAVSKLSIVLQVNAKAFLPKTGEYRAALNSAGGNIHSDIETCDREEKLPGQPFPDIPFPVSEGGPARHTGEDVSRIFASQTKGRVASATITGFAGKANVDMFVMAQDDEANPNKQPTLIRVDLDKIYQADIISGT